MKASEVLEKAADLIEPEGAWTQKAMRRGGGRCVIGAVASLCPRELNWDDVMAPFRQVVGLTRPFSDVVRWNDTPERTQAEVVQALRDAAALARQEGK